MCMLFFLPVELWREHILQSLTLLDIVSATSACHGHQLHSQFQILLYGLAHTQLLVVTSTQTDLLHWCLANNISSTSLAICGELDIETASFLPTFFARVTKLNFVEGNQDFEPIACARLVQLELYACSLNNLGSLSTCPQLKSLVLNKCPNITTESLLKSLNGCTALEDFVAVDCNTTDSRIVSGVLNHVPRLSSIQFCATFQHSFHLASVLTNLALEPTAYLFTRSIVMTSNCTACSTTLRGLATLVPQLQRLHLDRDDPANSVSDADIDFLCMTCPHLLDISLQRFAHLSSATLQSIALHLPLLQHLRVARCSEIRNESVISLANSCLKLESLRLAHCVNVTDEAVREVWLHCTRLKNLDLCGCVSVTDAAFASRTSDTLHTLDVGETNVQGSFIGQIPMVLWLECDDCLRINTTFVNSIRSHPNILQRLSLDGTVLSAADLLALSTHLPHLHSVGLSFSQADDNVVRSLVANCPHLQHISAWDCYVTEGTVEELMGLYQDRLKIYW